MRKSVFACALFLGVLQIPAGAQSDKEVPKELVQYVREARKAGMKPPQIRQNAVEKGWAEATVDDAIGLAGKEPESEAPSDSVAKADAPKDPVAKDPATVTGTSGGSAPAQPIENPPVKPPSDAELPKADPPKIAGTPVPVKPGSEADDYFIGEGDVLQISVYGEPTASVQSATVRPDGKISMPLLKDVKVAGLTPAQAEAYIQEQLSKVIRSPDVTVIAAQINSKKIFLTGAVKREGPLKYSYRMTVLQAISEAGGLTDYAKRKNIYVLHSENGRQYRLPFDYSAVLKGEHMEQNILLSPGDTIVVP